MDGAVGSRLGGADGGVDLCGQAGRVIDREVEVREALPLQGDDQRVLVSGDVPELRRALGMEGPGEFTAGLQPGSAPALGLVAQTGVVRGAAHVRERELQSGGVGPHLVQPVRLNAQGGVGDGDGVAAHDVCSSHGQVGWVVVGSWSG